MVDSAYLARWIDVTARLLAQPLGHDPMLEICDELTAHFRASTAATIDDGPSGAHLDLYTTSVHVPERWAARMGDHPLARHYRVTGDHRARRLSDALTFVDEPRARALLDGLRAAKLNDFAFLPLEPRSGMRHRWLSLSSSRELGSGVVHDLDRLGPLLRAVDAQASTLARLLAAPRPDPAAVARLSDREVVVLTLVARGLTAVAIGSELRISARTVSKHQENIHRKLGVADRVSAVMKAQTLGILTRRETARD